MDAIAAPSFEEGVVETVSALRKNAKTGIFSFGDLPRYSPNKMLTRVADKRIIFEEENEADISFGMDQVVTKAKPTEEQLAQMRIGCKMVLRVRSNTMGLMDPEIPATVGLGSGQTSRVLAFEVAIQRAGKKAPGSILVADGFIPFPDTIALAKANGIMAIVQPGGSTNDPKVIASADEAGITMVFTGQRLFWHGG
jgi:phosphoribosylaminoimidazolecarboxamide formyltransferase/IMP cyclohydrolase